MTFTGAAADLDLSFPLLIPQSDHRKLGLSMAEKLRQFAFAALKVGRARAARPSRRAIVPARRRKRL